MAELLLIKLVDVETNIGPTTTHKQVWICDICHKQIHRRKQISIRCIRIEHYVVVVVRLSVHVHFNLGLAPRDS